MFDGKLIRLREYRKSDFVFEQKCLNDYEVGRYYFFSIIPIANNEEKWISDKEGYDFVIETINNNVYIGGCGLHDTDFKNKNTFIHMFIVKDCWNMGYGSEALNLIVDYIFNELGLLKIKLDVFGFNERAISFYKKNGFIIESILKKEIYREGNYHDIMRMVMYNKIV